MPNILTAEMIKLAHQIRAIEEAIASGFTLPDLSDEDKAAFYEKPAEAPAEAEPGVPGTAYPSHVDAPAPQPAAQVDG